MTRPAKSTRWTPKRPLRPWTSCPRHEHSSARRVATRATPSSRDRDFEFARGRSDKIEPRRRAERPRTPPRPQPFASTCSRPRAQRAATKSRAWSSRKFFRNSNFFQHKTGGTFSDSRGNYAPKAMDSLCKGRSIYSAEGSAENDGCPHERFFKFTRVMRPDKIGTGRRAERPKTPPRPQPFAWRRSRSGAQRDTTKS